MIDVEKGAREQYEPPSIARRVPVKAVVATAAVSPGGGASPTWRRRHVTPPVAPETDPEPEG